MRLSDKERALRAQHGWKSSADLKRLQRAEENRAEKAAAKARREKREATKGAPLLGVDDEETR